MTTVPTKNTSVITPEKIAKVVGRFAWLPLDSDTQVGIVPPIAKPRFHDSPVPLARIAVGNRSFRKIKIGA